jgi:hypothetical protein
MLWARSSPRKLISQAPELPEFSVIFEETVDAPSANTKGNYYYRVATDTASRTFASAALQADKKT